MSVTFLQNNKVNYAANSSDNTASTLNYDGQTVCTHSDSAVFNTTLHDSYYTCNSINVYEKTLVSTDTTVLKCTNFPNRIVNNLIYNVSISLTSSDFTQITSNDTVTFNIFVNDNKIYQCIQRVNTHSVNTYNFTDIYRVNSTLSNFYVTATSTTPLYIRKASVNNIKEDGHMFMNCFLLM